MDDAPGGRQGRVRLVHRPLHLAAGAAGDHYGLLVFGLVLSIALMAFAATLISNWIKKYKWIAWAGLLAILIVAIELIYTDIKILFL